MADERKDNATDEAHRIASKLIEDAEKLMDVVPQLTADVAQLAVDTMHRTITRVQELAHLREGGPPPAG